MARFVFLASLLSSAYATAAQSVAATNDSEVCIIRVKPATTTLASLPTKHRTITHTNTKTVNVTQDGVLATPAAVTSTVLVTPGANLTSDAASTTTVTVTRSGSVNGTGECASTEIVTAKATTTVYTGSYNSTVAKRTAAPQLLDLSLPRRQAASQVASMQLVVHKMGHPQMVGPQREPFEVDCLDVVTAYHTVTSTISGASAASATTEYVTSTVSPSAQSSQSAPPMVTETVTVDAPSSFNNSTAAAVCTSTKGSATATTTQHIKCAPTNLITSIDGYGIGSTQGHTNETQGLAPGSDPSACCQLCVNTEDCAASEDDQKAGNCFLWYTSSPTCGLGFSYSDGGQTLAPGAGFSVQSGCGSIAGVSSSQ